MITLTADQQNAAGDFMVFMTSQSQKYMIIEGFAGTGKTTLVSHLLENVDKQMRMLSLLLGRDPNDMMDIYITAPTNKAAKVVAALIPGGKPKTIQSLLELKIHNNFSTGETKLVNARGNGPAKTFSNSLIIIDEFSFVDQLLLDRLDKATPGCKVLFIGDRDQIVSPNDTSMAVKNMGAPTSTLTTFNRNAGPIAILADQFRQAIYTGEFPNITPVNSKIEHLLGPDFQKSVDSHFSVPSIDEDDLKIIAWTNERVNEYNAHVRKLRGNTGPLTVGELVVTNKPIMITDGPALSTDQVGCVTAVGSLIWQDGVEGNMVELNNTVSVFTPTNFQDMTNALKTSAARKDWGTYFQIKEKWGDLRPVHSCTTHKSQGSTYKVAFIDLGNICRCTNVVDVARMLYVATARAADKVVFYGELPPHYKRRPV